MKKGSAKSQSKKQAKPAAKKAAGSAAALSSKDQAELLELDESYEVPPDHGVPEMQQEGLNLKAATAANAPKLLKGTRLKKNVLADLGRRLNLLDSTESAWRSRRLGLTGGSRVELRHEAEHLKRDAVAALRYYLAEDLGVQKRVDAIQEGRGLPDLVDDMKRIAELLRECAAELKESDLPKNAAARATELASELGDDEAAEKADSTGTQLQALRNRAFWYLSETMEEIRAAGRYVFRADPKKLVLFRSTKRMRPAPVAKKGTPEGGTPPAK